MFFESVAYAMGGAGTGAEGGGNPVAAFMPLILMFVIFYFLLIRPQQKKAKQHKETLAGLTKGDKIITSGGLYGRITSVEGDVLTVDLGNELQVEVNRGFVSGLSERAPSGSKKG